MIEFLQFAFAPAIAVFSLLLCVVLLYWLVVIAGLLDTDFLNVDLDADAGMDIDVGGGHDMDVGDDVGGHDMDGSHDMDGNVADAGGAFRAMLSFFYLGRVPVTVLVTLMVFSMWVLAAAVNQVVNPSGGLLLGLPIAAGAIVASLFVVKALGWPFAKLYKAMHANPGQLNNVVGQMCVLLTMVESGRTGQAQVDTTGAPAVVNVTVEPGVTLDRGSEAVILEYRRAVNLYVVAPVNLDETDTN